LGHAGLFFSLILYTAAGALVSGIHMLINDLFPASAPDFSFSLIT
jgi:hypothetical protein